MHDADDPVAAYQQAWHLTQEMLQAAAQDHWDAMLEMHAERETIVHCIQAQNFDLSRLNSMDKLQIRDCIQAMLQAGPVLEQAILRAKMELGTVLNAMQAPSLNKAYGVGSEP